MIFRRENVLAVGVNSTTSYLGVLGIVDVFGADGVFTVAGVFSRVLLEWNLSMALWRMKLAPTAIYALLQSGS